MGSLEYGSLTGVREYLRSRSVVSPLPLTDPSPANVLSLISQDYVRSDWNFDLVGHFVWASCWNHRRGVSKIFRRVALFKDARASHGSKLNIHATNWFWREHSWSRPVLNELSIGVGIWKIHAISDASIQSNSWGCGQGSSWNLIVFALW